MVFVESDRGLHGLWLSGPGRCQRLAIPHNAGLSSYFCLSSDALSALRNKLLLANKMARERWPIVSALVFR